MEETTPKPHKRSLFNLQLMPDTRFRTCFALSSLTALIAACLSLSGLVTVLHAPEIDSDLVLPLWGSITFAILSAVVSLVFGALVSHRIYGPLVSIRRQLARMEAGDFSARGTLRRGDELIEVMESLNRIAENLEKAKK
jgi:methyl-accepting chemotaxis protein